MDTARRVYLRFAFSRDPKIVSKEFDKLRAALKHLETAQGELTDGANFHAYSQAIDSFRDVKYFLEHAGVQSLDRETKALTTLSKNPFAPAQALEENKSVFKDALAEVGALEAEFGKASKPKSASHFGG